MDPASHRRHWPAPPALSPWLARSWHWSMPAGGRLPSLYPGTGAELIGNLGCPVEIRVCGPDGESMTRRWLTGETLLLAPRRSQMHFQSRGPVHWVGTRLRSGALFPLLGHPLTLVGDTPCSLADLGLPALEEGHLRAGGVTALLDWLMGRAAPLPLLAQGVERLYYGATLTTLQQDLAMSERSLQRHLRPYLGISTRQFLHIARFQRALRLLHQSGQSLESAHQAGFCDQSHFIKSCRRFTGLSPGCWLASEPAGFSHYGE